MQDSADLVQDLIDEPGLEAPTAPGGHWHDLERLAAAERARVGAVDHVRIAWGRSARAGQQLRSIRLGVYDELAQVIRIHRRLDDPRVAPWVLRFVLYHELLHARLGVHHTREFRRAEARHPTARAFGWWLDAHRKRLLSAEWQPIPRRRS